MKLVSDALSPTKLLLRIEERLRMRGIRSTLSDELSRMEAPVEVDVWRHFLESLTEDMHADRSEEGGIEGGPLSPFRRLLRVPLQPVLSAVLRRQVRFNGHVTETYAHLAAEVQRLEAEVASLREALEDSASLMKEVRKALGKAQEDAVHTKKTAGSSKKTPSAKKAPTGTTKKAATGTTKKAATGTAKKTATGSAKKSIDVAAKKAATGTTKKAGPGGVKKASTQRGTVAHSTAAKRATSMRAPKKTTAPRSGARASGSTSKRS